MRAGVQGVVNKRQRTYGNALTTQKASWMFHRMAEHLDLGPEEAEEYWPGFYEMRLMAQLDYLTAVVVEEPHCLIGSVEHHMSPHNYAHPLPASTLARVKAEMHRAYQAEYQAAVERHLAEQTAAFKQHNQKEEDEVQD